MIRDLSNDPGLIKYFQSSESKEHAWDEILRVHTMNPTDFRFRVSSWPKEKELLQMCIDHGFAGQAVYVSNILFYY